MIKKEINQLNELFQRARDIPFFKEKYKHLNIRVIHSKADFEKLPILRSSDFVNYEGKEKNAYQKRSRLTKSGNPEIPLSTDDFNRLIDFEVKKFKQLGLKKNDKFSMVDFTLNATIPYSIACINLGGTYVVLEGDFETMIRDIIVKNVNVIYTHPRFTKFLIDFVKKNKLRINLKMIINGGEKIDDYEFLANEVRLYLGARLIDSIGSRELSNFAIMCPYNNYFHFLDDQYVELVNSDGFTDNNEGELVITSLWKKDFPLLRYGTGDFSRYSKKICQCKFENKKVFNGVEERVFGDVKVGDSMISLQEIYENIHHAVTKQYWFDFLLNKYFRNHLDLLVLVPSVRYKNELIYFFDKKMFYSTLRRKRFLYDRIVKKHNIKLSIELCASKVLKSIIGKEKLVDCTDGCKNSVLRRLLIEKKYLNE